MMDGVFPLGFSGLGTRHSLHEVVGSIPGLAQWVKGSGIAMSCGVGCTLGSDLALLWLWRRWAAAAQTQPLAPYGNFPMQQEKKS